MLPATDQDLKTIADTLTKNLSELHRNLQNKKQFYQKINGETSRLFALISDHPTITHRELTKILESVHVRVLIKNKNHFSADDLKTYLVGQAKMEDLRTKQKINKHEKKRSECKIQLAHRYYFEELVQNDYLAFEQMRNSLRNVLPQTIFNEIDFFGNGYFDGNSLLQFLKHYSSKGQGVGNIFENNFETLEQLCTEGIRYLKNSATADKIFFKDFLAILAEKPEEEQEVQELDSPNAMNRTIGHIAKTTDIQLMNSRNRSRFNRSRSGDPSQSFLSPTFNFALTTQGGFEQTINFPMSFTHTNNNSNFTNTMIVHPDDHSNVYHAYIDYSNRNFDAEGEKIRREIQKIRSQQPSFEEKLKRMHHRNAKYLQRIKKQIGETRWNYQGKYAKDCSIKGIFANGLSNPESINVPQILYQLRYLGTIFANHHKEVTKFIDSNPKFTLVNGFNVLDFTDQEQVNLNAFKDFISESGIVIHEPKVMSFFQQMAEIEVSSGERIMKYHHYVNKIFRLKSLEPYYDIVSRRKPLLMERWPEEQRKNYCRFIRSMITLFSQREQAKIGLCKMLGNNFAQTRKLPQEKWQIQEELLEEMQEKFIAIFGESRIYPEQMYEILHKGCEGLIGELLKENSVIQSSSLLSFLLD